MITKIDPEMFRKQVGQYKDRWYIDPLPTCPIAQQDLEWVAPSVSTLKKAAAKDWTQVSLQRAGEHLASTRPDLSGMDGRQISDLLTAGSGAGLEAASLRGNEIHRMFEAYADGTDPRTLNIQVEAAAFVGTALRIIRDWQPKIVFSEFVCISRTKGYGGTADAIWDIDGDLYLVDYKTRANKPAVYLEEIWQCAAYANCDYAIRINPETGEPERFLLPQLAGAMILSITPQDYQLRPVSITESMGGFETLIDFWRYKSMGISPIAGKPWPKPKLTRDTWVRDRVDAIKAIDIAPLLSRWPQDVPKPKATDLYTDDQIDQLLPVLDMVETLVSAPWPETDPGRSDVVVEPVVVVEPEPLIEEPLIDEGDLMPEAMAAIQHRFGLLTTAQSQWVSARVVEAREFGSPIRPAEIPSARRVFIARGLILALEKGMTERQLWTCLQVALDLTDDITATQPMGVWLGALGSESAATFAALVKIAAPDTPGQPTISEVATAAAEKSSQTKPKTTRKKAAK